MTEPWELEARLSIMHVISRYAAEIDVGSLADLVSLFDVEGVLIDYAGREYRGRPAIRAFIESSRRSRSGSAGAAVRHHMSPSTIEFADAETAVARSCFLALGDRGPDHWGAYRDRLIQTDGSWRFACRRVTIDGASPGGWLGSRGDAPLEGHPDDD